MKNTNHIVVLVGVCGIGKTTIGAQLAKELDVPFYDVDKLPYAEVSEKSVDIHKWLSEVQGLILKHVSQKGCVLSCSILKKEHRKTLTATIDYPLDWVFMNDSFENASRRVEVIQEHNRPVSLLKSDFETLEVPKRALTVDMDNTEQVIVDTILKYLARKYG
ncbi:gluconokinase [Maribacter sedimenticola]|uniref:gluconokinase n=1 Tax=Maribacter sedimenticola TaxID=228956 RepID=A0ABY1SDW6_9FLAO|nr:shikimate kinase [Maribacter sedimenticola]SNR27316.1 gluconokinase [Maribacter sedimenticola]